MKQFKNLFEDPMINSGWVTPETSGGEKNETQKGEDGVIARIVNHAKYLLSLAENKRWNRAQKVGQEGGRKMTTEEEELTERVIKNPSVLGKKIISRLGKNIKGGEEINNVVKKITSFSSPYLLVALLELLAGRGYCQTKVRQVPKMENPVERLEYNKSKVAIVKVGENYISFGGERFFLIHHIEKPESLGELVKMLIEPISVAITFSIDRNDWPVNIILDSREMEISVDFPYKYAQDFKTAAPVDKKRMEEEIRQNIHGLLEKILELVIGPSFFKKEVGQTVHLARQEEGKDIEVKRVNVTGYASAESRQAFNINSDENKTLSRLRAENAAGILEKIFKEAGIKIEDLNIIAGGEVPLRSEEIINLSRYGDVLELIKRYNDGEIEEAEIKEKLNKYIGEKRKVSVVVELGEREVIFVLPIPLFLLGLLPLLKEFTRPTTVFSHFVFPEQNIEFNQEKKIVLGKRARSIRSVAGRPAQRSDFVKKYTFLKPEDRLKWPEEEIYEKTFMRALPHKKQGVSRQKTELRFDPELSHQEKMKALAFLIDRELRMANTIVNYKKTNIDFIHFCPDKKPLEELIREILNKKITINPSDEVFFQFETTGVIMPFFSGGRETRRQRPYYVSLWIGNKCFRFGEEERKKLAALAENYIETHRIEL